MSRQKKERYTIAFVSSYLYDRVFVLDLWSGISDASNENNANILCYFGDQLKKDDLLFQENLIYKFINKDIIDGVILWTSDLTMSLDEKKSKVFLNQFKDIPVVSIGRSEKFFNSHTVYLDDESSIKIIMDHLIKVHNYKKIAFIRGPETHIPSQIRYNTYISEFKKNNIKFDHALISNPALNWKLNFGKMAIQLFLDDRKLQPKKDIEAIINVSDFFAYEAVKELNRRGYHVPEDIAVIGFNNTLESSASSPPLTTFNMNQYYLGYNAVKLLTSLIEDKNVSSQNYFIQGELIIRESCGCFYQEKYNKHENLISSIITDYLNEDNLKLLYEEFNKIINIKIDDLNFEFFKSMLNSFYLDCKNENSSQFIIYFQKLIFYIKKENINLDICNDLLFMIKKYYLIIYSKDYNIDRIENIMYQVQILIYNSIKNINLQNKYNDFNRIISVKNFGMKLMTILNKTDFVDILSKYLLNIGITSCFISLFVDINNPFLSSHIIFAFKENKKVDLDNNNIHFPTRDLIPANIMPFKNKFQYIIQSLSSSGRQIGFIVFESNKYHDNALEIIKNFINTALERILWTEEKEKFINQLEKKVEERTSELTEANLLLNSAIKEVKRANKAKSDFLTAISHEIKTPLSIMIGLVEKIIKIDDKNQQKKFNNLVHNESIKITELINQLLDLSKIEADRLIIQKNKFNIYNLLEDLKEAYQVIAHKKKLNFKMVIDKNIQDFLYGDELRLRQIIINLVGNAVKFTKKGGITVTVDIEKHEKNKVLLLFKVIDTGIGIPADKLDSIFNIFTQADDSINTKYGGTGLGTTISKQLVELMGGKIGIESTVGKGSTFWFTIPFDHN